MIRVDLDRNYYSEYFYKIYMNEMPALDAGYTLNEWLGDKVLNGEIFEWCEENLLGIWSFYVNNTGTGQMHLTHFYFSFALEQDAIAFKLRWL